MTIPCKAPFAVAAFLLSAQAATAATVELTATIRDFNDSHPNFQYNVDGGIVTGAVESTLGPDGKPVYVELGGGSDSFTNAADFNDWYSDTHPAAATKDITITLEDGGTGTYSFGSSSFFPIDDMLLQNQGRSHNYHHHPTPASAEPGA